MAAYFVFHNRVLDDAKMQEYIPKAIESMAPYHPEIVAIDDSCHVIEGSTDFPRMVVIRFASREDALAWYNSPAYQAVLPMRLAATEGFAVLVEGFVAPAS